MIRHIIIFFFLVSPTLLAQETVIRTNEVKDYIGQEVTVQGVIDQVTSLTDVRGQPTYFNMDGRYPNNEFTLLLWESDIHKFRKDVYFYEGKNILVTGIIKTYRDKLQMVIRYP